MPGTRAERAFLRQFGESAAADEIGIFGSEASGTPEASADPEELQSLSNWLDGWLAAILGGGNPALEDMNGAFFVFCYHLCYLLRAGVPEWNELTEYFNGDYVRAAGVPPPGVEGDAVIYKCIVSSASSTVGDDPADSPLIWRPINLESRGLNPQITETLAARAMATWTGKASADTSSWAGIIWVEELELFVAVAEATTGSDQVMTSPDGITWTGQTAASTLFWTALDYSPELGLIVAVALTGTGGTVQTMFSADGLTWSTAGVTSVSGQWHDVKWVPELGLFVAVGDSGGTNKVMTSPDGKVWTARAASAEDWVSVTWSEKLLRLVAVASTSKVMYSSDGITWVNADPAEAGQWFSVCWSRERSTFVAVARTGTNRVMISRDGINWVAKAASDPLSAWNCVIWAKEIGLFIAVAVSTTGTYQVMTSPDGITWTSAAASSVKLWEAVAWSPKLGIASAVASTGGATAGMTMISKYVKQLVY